MGDNTVSALLQLISAAVTPVVMISACAALILGVNNKHTSLSDRIRTLTSECRLPATSEARRSQLLEQLPLFYRRYRLTWIALCALFGAVGAFLLTALLIVFTQRRIMVTANGTLALFILGVFLMLVASGLEVAEVALSMRSLRIELRDILPPPSNSSK